MSNLVLISFHLNVRPCIRRNFPNVLFSRVSEKFSCQSSEIFRKKPEFSNSQNFRKKVRKLFKNVRKFQKFRKKYVKFEFLSQKTLFWGQKVWKKFGKSLEKVRKWSEKVWYIKFGNFGNWIFRMFGNFGNCYFPNFPKFTKK